MRYIQVPSSFDIHHGAAVTLPDENSMKLFKMMWRNADILVCPSGLSCRFFLVYMVDSNFMVLKYFFVILYTLLFVLSSRHHFLIIVNMRF